ncbi:tRNA(Ile)-lysidine synthase [Flavobacterium arsenatis]|uniref:tRNA(Ile)-lysidine synthase n=1 Tax=Flavobacterium arsenatis TaxID=1484332 RepID=A0ABU1TU53_9FLAO|nr:tRNA lysidine(34) synthetase TilS [Flavobacterium arsenatis]MDR6969366.1 tRNA(Ile)-lysidine synthase [Flavobacterium arsenatis]
MISKFQKHLSQNLSFLAHKKLLLAISGGIDSMVLLDLFRKSGFEIAIAHCNFQLRGQESDGDQAFIENYSKKNNIPLFVTQFDTKAFAEDFKLSIQVAARELRYKWFYELLESNQYDYVLTAHHADDNIETFLINLSRGSGLEGFTGIPVQNDKTVRPLLPYSRDEILEYAKENSIEWHEDSSNASDKYLRNKIRQEIVPVLKSLNPNLLSSFQNTVENLQQSMSLVDDASRIVYRKVVLDEENQKKINLKELLQLPNYKAYLYQWLNPFGFKAWNDIYNLVESQSGKQIFSDGFKLLKDREYLILSPQTEIDREEKYWIEENQEQVNFHLKLSFCKISSIGTTTNTTIFVDQNKLKYPLVLRRWEEGDVFYPLGMNGKSKKLSKFFKDEKFSLIDKENTLLLCSENQIVWVVGIRQDERFKIETTTKQIIQIALQE